MCAGRAGGGGGEESCGRRLQASSRRHPPARCVWLVPLVQMPPAEYINRNNDFLWRASRFQSPCAYKGNKSLHELY